jgi:hypothetical protein
MRKSSVCTESLRLEVVLRLALELVDHSMVDQLKTLLLLSAMGQATFLEGSWPVKVHPDQAFLRSRLHRISRVPRIKCPSHPRVFNKGRRRHNRLSSLLDISQVLKMDIHQLSQELLQVQV